jgi:hypothetical protein
MKNDLQVQVRLNKKDTQQVARCCGRVESQRGATASFDLAPTRSGTQDRASASQPACGSKNGADHRAARPRGRTGVGAEEAAKRNLAPKVGRETIRILLQSHDLKPRQEKSWCNAELNEEYIRRMEVVLALCETPLWEKEPAVCVDEKPVVLHPDVCTPRLMLLGKFARRDCEYQRRANANALCGVKLRAGRHFTRSRPPAPRRSSPTI